jgi:glutaredoxin
MDSIKIYAYCRIDCPHSNKTKLLLEQLPINYKRQIILVENDELAKMNIKTKLKKILNGYSTFPIILYKTSKNKLILVGGNSDLEKLLNILPSIQSKEDILELKLSKGQAKLLYYLFLNR